MWGWIKGDFVLLIEVVQLTLHKTSASHLVVLSQPFNKYI